MIYDDFFAEALVPLRHERRYRVFVELERIAGRFPSAIWHSPHGPQEVVIWCSNDYLGMGQHPKVIGSMVQTATRLGTGAGGTRKIDGAPFPLSALPRGIARPPRTAAGPSLTPSSISKPRRSPLHPTASS